MQMYGVNNCAFSIAAYEIKSAASSRQNVSISYQKETAKTNETVSSRSVLLLLPETITVV